jgi:inhibitor of cysteine peptidase
VNPSTNTVAASAALTPADDGKTIEVPVGAEVVIRLPDNPSTGYRWEIDTDKACVSVARQHFEQQSDLVGGGGESSWVLRAIAPGVSPVKLMLRRPWEDERAAIQRFAVTLRIAP